MARTLIMSPERVSRTLNRLAYEVIERNRGTQEIEIFGIRKRGTVLARALAERIGEVEHRTFQVSALDVSPFRDDRPSAEQDHSTSEIMTEVTERDLILVDDVLFTGRTARAALDAIVQLGRPRSIQLVVLIDRGHREYPIQPDYVGRVIPTKHDERVVVQVDDAFAVYIED